MSSPEQKIGTTTFTHSDDPSGAHNISPLESTYNIGSSTDTSLGDFLCRPVRIATLEWSPGSNLNSTYDPWSLFLDDSRVKARLEGFKHVRGHLKIRATVTGNPGQFGRAILAYYPRFARSVHNETSNLTAGNLVRLTQLPHVFLDPATGEGAEMTLPFFCPENFIDVTNTTSATSMGRLVLQSMQVLRHVSNADQPASIQLFAWMEDAVICTPTALDYDSITYQAQLPDKKKDEFSTGPVSKVASAIAKGAGTLSAIPVIKPYMLATEMAASTVGKVAHIFGYSRPQVIDNLSRYREFTAGELATTNTHEAVARLALENKSQLTVDPRTVGLDGTDEMAFSHILQKQCFIERVSWQEISTTGSVLTRITVSPFYKVFDATVSPARTYLPPTSAVGQLFRYWKGTMKYRFMIVGSAYHRGKIRVTYDPSGGTSTNFNEIYSRVIDIAETRDFEIPVHWHAETPWLACNPGITGTSTPRGFGPSVTHTGGNTNGRLTLEVFDTLTSPDPGNSAPVGINIFVRGGDDLEFAMPLNMAERDMTFRSTDTLVQPQAGLDGDGIESNNAPEDAKLLEPLGDVPTPTQDMTGVVFMGESVKSFRALLKRYVRDSTSTPGSIPLRLPITTGDPVSLQEYVMAMYAGWRGSIRFKAISAFSNDSIIVSGNLFQTTAGDGLSGDFSNAGTVEFECPFYSNKRFEHCQTGETWTADTDTRVLSMNRARVHVDQSSSLYRAIGEDFSTFFFIGLPPVYATGS